MGFSLQVLKVRKNGVSWERNRCQRPTEFRKSVFGLAICWQFARLKSQRGSPILFHSIVNHRIRSTRDCVVQVHVRTARIELPSFPPATPFANASSVNRTVDSIPPDLPNPLRRPTSEISGCSTKHKCLAVRAGGERCGRVETIRRSSPNEPSCLAFYPQPSASGVS